MCLPHCIYAQALKEAFELFCNKDVAGCSSAESLAAFCDNILRKGGSEKLSEEAVEETLDKVQPLRFFFDGEPLRFCSPTSLQYVLLYSETCLSPGCEHSDIHQR